MLRLVLCALATLAVGAAAKENDFFKQYEPPARGHPSGAPPPRLSGIPQLRHLFAEADAKAATVSAAVSSK